MIHALRLIAAAGALSLFVHPVETKTWTHKEASEFEKGTIKGLALSTSGRLSLAPEWKQLFDAESAHIWTAAAEGGRVYAGGIDGKVFVHEKESTRLLATLEGGTVYSLAASAGVVYAGVAPEAKVYRLDPAGKVTLLAELKAKYLWALAPAPGGAVYAATGEPGQVWRIEASGQTKMVFDAEEAHVRSLVLDSRGQIVAGTEPRGLVFRISPAGQGFVLVQTGKREVTALAAAADGCIYAAAAGNRSALQAPSGPLAVTPVTATPQAAAAQPGQAAAAQRPPVQTAPPAMSFGAAPAAGGSEVWRIAADGEPRRLWTHAQAVAFALVLDSKGNVLVGTGSEGKLHRIDDERTSTLLVDADASQITALVPGPRGSILAATANPGKLFQLGPGAARSGYLESDVLDAGGFTYWGRLRHEGELEGGSIRLEARSGNLDSGQSFWSPWSPVDPARGSRIEAPPARFLAWRATIEASPTGASPVLSLVEAAYQMKNLPPSIERLEVTPANYKFPTSSLTASPSLTLSLPPLGQPQRQSPTTPNPGDGGAVSMNYEKGFAGARWRVSDANGDTVESTLEIRGAGEREWKPLKSGIKESRYSWDATGLADGRYRLRLTATDQPDNYPGMGLTATMESDEFVIDNTPPEIETLIARLEGSKIILSFRASDASSALQSAEYSINGGEWIAAQPTTRITDSQAHDYAAEAARPGQSEITIAVRVTDEVDNVAVRKTTIR
jgi:outer membrane protein assembly factor BamB